MTRTFKNDLETNKPSDDENIQGQVDPFDRAIPGQSLTEEPGKGSFERPPTLETPEEALQFALDRMQQPDSFKESVVLMQQGVSIESMVKTLTFVMFRGGLITPDLMMIIQPYLFMWLMGRARDHNITPILFDSHDDERLPVFSSMSKTMTPEKAESIIGEVFKGKKLEEVKITTKCRLGTLPDEEVYEHLNASLTRSLDRLNMERVDYINRQVLDFIGQSPSIKEVDQFSEKCYSYFV